MLPTVPKPTMPIDYTPNPYLNHEETAIVVKLISDVKPKVVLEIGTNRGITAKTILASVSGIETYLGVDVPADYLPALPSQLSEVPPVAGDMVDDRRFLLLSLEHGSQTLKLKAFDGFRVGAVFIDGDHSYGVVLQDSLLARDLVSKSGGGVIVWHDYDNPATEVKPCLDRLHREGWTIAHVDGTWIAFMTI